MNGYGSPSNSGPCGGPPSSAAQIVQGYQKLFFVDLFYTTTSAPYDLTGVLQITAGFPGTGGIAPVLEVQVPISFTATGTTTNLSNILQTLSSVAGITLGMQVTGAGIPVGTTVQMVNPTAGNIPATVQLSNAAAASAANVTLTFSTGMTVVTTGDTTATSHVLANIASTAGVLVGQTITGAGIPAGTTVVAVGATTVSMSAAATATATTQTLTFTLSAQVSVVGAPGAGRLAIGVPAADSALMQINPSTLQNQDLQVSVTNADGSVTAFALFNTLNVILPSYGVLP